MRIAHLTTVDMSLALLLGTELEVDVLEGHEVFGISAPGPYVERVEALGTTHVAVPQLTRSWHPRRDLAAFRQIFRTIRGLDLDVLHTHNPKTGVMGRIAGRLAGVPVVVNTCHGLWARPEDRFAKRVFVYGLEGLAARFSDFELFQNAEDMKTMRWALKRGRHRVVGNGVDLDRFAFDPEGRRRVRAELGVADDELLVGTVGRRVREKGVAEFAEAASRLRERATFVWVGPEDATEPSVRDGHADAVRFVDERTDMPAVYSAFDVFVLASHREGFSRASMEAAACGIPMVLTDIRGCREIGDHGRHVLLVPARDDESLTGAVECLLGDAALRARLGDAVLARARKEFDQKQVARASLNTYAAAMQPPRPCFSLIPHHRYADPMRSFPKVKRLKRIVRILIANLPLRTKLGLLRAESGRGNRDLAIPVGDTEVFVAHATRWIDYLTLYGALIDRHFDADVGGKVVLDVGAHKGYFGARVISEGASKVESFEPVHQNLTYLQRSASRVPAWEVHESALGARAGTVDIHLNSDSWAHSIQEPPAGLSIGVQTVAVEALSDVLTRAASWDRPVVVKINVEGAAGPMILGTSAPDWEAVEWLWVDVEPSDPVGREGIVGHLDRTPLRLWASDGRRLLFTH